MIVWSDTHRSHRSVRRRKAPRLQVHDVVRGARHRLILSGELDMESAPDLEEALCVVSKQRTRGLVLDLTRLTFLDLCGLRMVLFARELCEWQGCDFGLVSGPGNVQRVFEPSDVLDPSTPILAGKRCSAGPLQSS
ncbi:MAG TPA: STAS domain-containing protein [Solirubrobacteraceae bacterium]|jgi:anti-anti-sigma factor|nr:STAS domain-containing protein [Solirubrobacteraceae bacterium]